MLRVKILGNLSADKMAGVDFSFRLLKQNGGHFKILKTSFFPKNEINFKKFF